MPSKKNKRGKGNGGKSGSKGKAKSKDKEGSQKRAATQQLQSERKEQKENVLNNQLLNNLTLNEGDVCNHGCPPEAAKRGRGSIRMFMNEFDRKLNEIWDDVYITDRLRAKNGLYQ